MANALHRWEPGAGIALRDAINQLFEDSFVRPFNGSEGRSGSLYLPLDVYETAETFVVKAYLPGVSADKVDITAQQNTVTIRAEQPSEQQEGVQYHLRERPSGTWVRSFDLPTAIDGQHIDAKLQDGVLVLTLPKAPEARPRKVRIQTA